MKKDLTVLQEWLIAVALCFVLPATVYLGCRLIAKVDYATYQKERKIFFKGYDFKNDEQYEKREKDWDDSDSYQNFKKQQTKRNLTYLMVAGPISCILMYIGTIFVMPIIASSFVITSIFMLTMYAYSYGFGSSMYGINLILFELLFLGINLLLALYAAYRLSEE